LSTVKTHGYGRKSGVPALEGTRPKVCARCDSWFAAASRQRLCGGCIPRRRRTERAIGDLGKCAIKNPVYPRKTRISLMTQTPTSLDGSRTGRAFTYEDLCRMQARRTGKAMDWLDSTGRPVRQYPGYQELTGREISVAIGWVPWPASWPERRRQEAAA
jgi:hypothetical protein